MNKQSGFTVIELVIVSALLVAASVIFMIQKNNLSVAARDEQRKTAINAIYYSLEEAYYPKNNHYPETLNSETLSMVDPNLLIDPNGRKLSDARSDYRYEPVQCANSECEGYTLRSTLENEADFVRKSRNN